jgi:hypothetical protein
MPSTVADCDTGCADSGADNANRDHGFRAAFGSTIRRRLTLELRGGVTLDCRMDGRRMRRKPVAFDQLPVKFPLPAVRR